MDKDLLVIFGLPGAGKSFVADMLASQFGYISYNGDTDIPEEMKKSLMEKLTITDAMRKQFIANMIASIKKIRVDGKKVVIHQAFIKEFMRVQFLETFPNAKFILVKSPNSIREQRYMKRAYFNLGLPYLRHMSSLFEKVHIPHWIIQNSTNGTQEIELQIKKLLSDEAYSK